MSLDYALPKKFPHKLALIDVQFFLENVSTHYLRHVLFVWRLLTWKKKKEIEVSKELAEWWKQQRFVHLANSQQYFSVEGHAGDLQSRVNSWWLLVPQFLPCSPGACMCCRLHASQWRCPPASETVPCSQNEAAFHREVAWLLPTLGCEQNAERVNVKKKKCPLLLFVMHLRVCALVTFVLPQVSILTRERQDSIKIRLEFGYFFFFLNSVGRTWHKAIGRNVPKSWEVFLSC